MIALMLLTMVAISEVDTSKVDTSKVDTSKVDYFWGEKKYVTVTRYTSSDFVKDLVFSDSMWVRESKDQFTIKLTNGTIRYLPKNKFDVWPGGQE
jgi:hypothetical protein